MTLTRILHFFSRSYTPIGYTRCTKCHYAVPAEVIQANLCPPCRKSLR
jgi:hypothetical protein